MHKGYIFLPSVKLLSATAHSRYNTYPSGQKLLAASYTFITSPGLWVPSIPAGTGLLDPFFLSSFVIPNNFTKILTLTVGIAPLSFLCRLVDVSAH